MGVTANAALHINTIRDCSRGCVQDAVSVMQVDMYIVQTDTALPMLLPYNEPQADVQNSWELHVSLH